MPSMMPELRALGAAEFEGLRAGAEVLEQDAHGIKVLRLPDGDMLKLFRVKRRWSSARFSPYSKRFCRNALRLARLGVPTVGIKAWYRLPTPGLTAVLYKPLPGQTLRQVAAAGGLDLASMRKLGVFVARLHRHGVYFRSLHLGNIVLNPAGELGLIDVADLSIKPWRLICGQRLRNFRHLCRVQGDRDLIRQAGWQGFAEAYLEVAAVTGLCAQKLSRTLHDLFA